MIGSNYMMRVKIGKQNPQQPLKLNESIVSVTKAIN